MSKLKEKLCSKFKIGEKVICNWKSGGLGFNKEGIITDNSVNYNGYNEFSKENCELACIIRFKNNQVDWEGDKMGIHEVVPVRLIKKLSSLNKELSRIYN